MLKHKKGLKEEKAKMEEKGKHCRERDACPRSPLGIGC
jgi:hypothetical protein